MNLSKKTLKAITRFMLWHYDCLVDYDKKYHETAYHYSNQKKIYRW